MTMALRCTGSNRRKYTAERTEPDGTKTGACMDCDGRFGLHPKTRQDWVLVLDAHEPYVATTVREALSATPSPQTEAEHLEAIRKEAKP
jgi:chemotaxis signal transduction protein